jgi:hypothetical protein
MHRWVGVLVLGLLSPGYGQLAPLSRDQLREEAAKNVAALNQQLPELLALTPHEKELQAACRVNCSDPQVQSGLDAMSARIFATLADVAAKTQREIDNYIIHAVNPKHPQLDHESIVKDLVKILGDRADGTPSAFVLDRTDGRTLVVAYEFGVGVTMGPGSGFFTLRAYRATDTTLKLINATGDDMNGYLNHSVKQLPSPVPGQLWLLVWGQASGANGPNIRMRGYAFDGK